MKNNNGDQQAGVEVDLYWVVGDKIAKHLEVRVMYRQDIKQECKT